MTIIEEIIGYLKYTKNDNMEFTDNILEKYGISLETLIEMVKSNEQLTYVAGFPYRNIPSKYILIKWRRN